MAESLYIHIPFCISKCKYCDFFSEPCNSSQKIDEYIFALSSEIKFRLKQYSVDSIDTIYIGGGTPSLLNKSQLDQIFKTINDSVQIQKNAEITIEVNPDDVTEELINIYKRLGINRISCGIQSLNNESLHFVSRRADVNINRHALELLKTKWDGLLSIDVICGLPKENKLTFLNNLRELLNYYPDHISMYSLTIEEGTPLEQMIESGKIDYDFDEADDMWISGRDFLESKGYKQYEVSNFCKNDKQCKHNLKYWNHQNYIGVGCGGTGTFYSKTGEGVRWTNKTDIGEYIKYWENPDRLNTTENIEIVNLTDSKFEFFMMGLRKTSGITDLEYENTFNEKIPGKYIKIFSEWEKNNLCKIEKDKDFTRYTLGKKGIIYLNQFLNSIME